MSAAQQCQLESLAELLRTAPLNLLSQRDRELVWERHVGEAARVWEALVPQPHEQWMDLGTGGGLPGLVLATLSPAAHFTLVDARAKKIAAVDGFVRELGLSNVRTLVGRAEELARAPEYRARFDAVVSRALGGLATVVELSRGFARPGGRIAVIRGDRVAQEAHGFEGLQSQLGVHDVQVGPVAGTERATWVVTMRAEGQPPRAIPRPNGVPAARPLAP